MKVPSSHQSGTRSFRISHVVSSISRASGGVGPVVRALSGNLAKSGHGVKVFCLRDSYTDQDSTQWEVPVLAFDAVGLRSFRYSHAVSQACSSCPADIVHSHGVWTYHGIAARKASVRQGVPLMISPHGMLDPWGLKVSRWKKKVASVLYEGRNLAAATCLHALCESEYRSIRDYGLKNPVAIIPNGVDLPCEDVTLPAPWSDERYMDKKVMLFLGRIHHKKNLHGLIEAWSRLRVKGVIEDWMLVVAGWCCGSLRDYEERVRQMVREQDLEASVCFTGPLYGEKKQAAFQNADCFVLPSYSEGLPMAVLEAWSYGLPVIMTAGCNIPEGFEAGAAIEIGPETKSIAQGVKHFVALPESNRQRMGRCGRRLAETKFAWPRIADQMVDVYEWMLGKHERPECLRMS